MPIPSYNSPQVQNAPLEAARLNPGMAPNPMGTIGQGLQNAAAGFDHIRQQADAARVEDALNPLRTDMQSITLRMTQFKGKNAVDPEAYGGDPGMSLSETALADFDKAVSARSESLNPQQKEMFDRAAQRFRAEVEHQVSNHETVQLNGMFQQIYKDTDTAEADHVSKLGVVNGLPDGPTIQQSLERRIANAQAWAQSQGLDVAPAVQAAKADTYRTVIAGMLAANNASGAMAYFSDHKMDLDERTRLQTGQIIQEHVLANDVQTKADEIAATGLPLDQQDAKARDAFKGNAEGQRALQSELEHRFQVKHSAQVAAVQDTTGKLWDMRFPTVPGQQSVSMPQIMRSPEWASLNGTQRNELRSQWESYSKRNENDPNLSVQRALAYYNTINDPNFHNLTDNQIKALTPALGPQLTVQVMKDLQEIRTNPGKLNEIHLDSQVLEASAKEFGLISGDKPNDAEKMNLAIMQSQAKQIMQASGQKWDYENQRKLYRELSQQVVTDRGWLWNTKAPLFEVRQTTQIPDNFLATVKARAAAAKVPMPSDATVYQLWFDAKAKGLVDDAGNLVQSSSVTPVTGATK